MNRSRTPVAVALGAVLALLALLVLAGCSAGSSDDAMGGESMAETMDGTVEGADMGAPEMADEAAGGGMAVEQVRSKLAQYAEREDVEDEERWMAEIGFQHRRLELTIEDGSVLFNLGYIERMAAAGLLSFVLSELRALASPMAKQWFAFCARWRTVLISNPTAIHQQALLEPVGSSVRDAIQTSDRHACFRVLDEHKIDADVALLCMAVKSNARHVAFGQSCSGGTSGAAVVWSPETDQRGMLSDKSDAVGGGAVAVDTAEIALAVDQRVTGGEFLRQAHQGVVNGGVPVGVVFADHVADDAGAFLESRSRVELQFSHRVQEPPVNGFKPVADVRQRPGDDG